MNHSPYKYGSATQNSSTEPGLVPCGCDRELIGKKCYIVFMHVLMMDGRWCCGYSLAVTQNCMVRDALQEATFMLLHPPQPNPVIINKGKGMALQWRFILLSTCPASKRWRLLAVNLLDGLRRGARADWTTKPCQSLSGGAEKKLWNNKLNYKGRVAAARTWQLQNT